jgi:hypothetical protein
MRILEWVRITKGVQGTNTAPIQHQYSTRRHNTLVSTARTFKGPLVRDVVCENDAVRVAVVRSGDAVELFLPGGVPNLDFHALA